MLTKSAISKKHSICLKAIFVYRTSPKQSGHAVQNVKQFCNEHGIKYKVRPVSGIAKGFVEMSIQALKRN